MRRMIYGLTVGLVAMAAGCGGTTPTGSRQDLASVPSDLGAADMPADLLPLPPDMSYILPVPASCNTTTAVSGTTAYTTLSANNRCMGGSCHNNLTIPRFRDQPTFMSSTINVNSTSVYKYVVPGNPDRSYLLYKLRNLQLKVMNGGGMQMPRGLPPLTDAEFCTMYNWVRSGAPTT